MDDDREAFFRRASNWHGGEPESWEKTHDEFGNYIGSGRSGNVPPPFNAPPASPQPNAAPPFQQRRKRDVGRARDKQQSQLQRLYRAAQSGKRKSAADGSVGHGQVHSARRLRQLHYLPSAKLGGRRKTHRLLAQSQACDSRPRSHMRFARRSAGFGLYVRRGVRARR